jgi:hypothetical protein
VLPVFRVAARLKVRLSMGVGSVWLAAFGCDGVRVTLGTLPGAGGASLEDAWVAPVASGAADAGVPDDATEATDDVTEATDDVTEATDDVTEATDDATDATDDVTDATDDVTDATDDATDATDDATEASAAADAPVVEAASPDSSTVPVPPVFTTATVVKELEFPEGSSDPTLTDDLKTLYFLTEHADGPGNTDVWVAKRDSSEGEFTEFAPVLEVSTPGVESSPAVSGDGSTLWVASRALAADGGEEPHDIWRSSWVTDKWSPRVLASDLNSALDDTPRPPGGGGLIMPIASRRDSTPEVTFYFTFLATRPSVTEPFAPNPRRLTELEVTGYNMADAFLTRDGLQIYFTRAAANKGDIYWARRDNLGDLFKDVQLLDPPINSAADDRDPWLSPDGTRLYFASNRDGVLKIYEARK